MKMELLLKEKRAVNIAVKGGVGGTRVCYYGSRMIFHDFFETLSVFILLYSQHHNNCCKNICCFKKLESKLRFKVIPKSYKLLLPVTVLVRFELKSKNE